MAAWRRLPHWGQRVGWQLSEQKRSQICHITMATLVLAWRRRRQVSVRQREREGDKETNEGGRRRGRRRGRRGERERSTKETGGEQRGKWARHLGPRVATMDSFNTRSPPREVRTRPRDVKLVVTQLYSLIPAADCYLMTPLNCTPTQNAENPLDLGKWPCCDSPGRGPLISSFSSARSGFGYWQAFFSRFSWIDNPPTEHPSDCQGGETVKHSRVRQTIQSVCPRDIIATPIAPYPQGQKQKHQKMAYTSSIHTCSVSYRNQSGQGTAQGAA